MAESRSFKEKYFRLREKFENLNKQRDELKHSLDLTKHKMRRLKEENNSSSLEDLLSDITSEDGGDHDDDDNDDEIKLNRNRYGMVWFDYKNSQSKSKSLTRNSKSTSLASRKARSSLQTSAPKNSGKRKADGASITGEPMQKRRKPRTTRVPSLKKKRDDRTDAKRVEPLPMNPDGTLKLPVTIGKGTNEVTIYKIAVLYHAYICCIGNIVWDREAYHTNRYIFPVGFMSRKQYLSAVDVTRKTTYTSEILDGGDNPIFQVTAEDQPGRKFAASSSSGVWKKILDEINIQGVPSKTHASGPEMLGLSHLGITKYIQELPGAEKCTKYVMQRWLDEDTPSKYIQETMIKQESGDELIEDEDDDEDVDSVITTGQDFPIIEGNGTQIKREMTSSWLYLVFTFSYPFLYLVNLWVRRQRRKAASPWNPGNKVVLITGASTGIGEALAHKFAQHGSRLVLCGRRTELLENVSRVCKELGAKDVFPFKVDVTKEDEVKNLIKNVEHTYDQLDCIILNAGVSMGETLESLPDLSIIREIMEVNYFGSVNVAFHSLPLLKKTPKSRILINSSMLGIVGARLRTGYSGSKFACRGFFEALQAELLEHDICVTIAYPGAVITEINKNRLGYNPLPLNLDKGMTSEQCAKDMFDATVRGDKEIVYTNSGKFVRLIEGIFPELTANLVSWVARRINSKVEVGKKHT
ncbi:hypothetical protein G9A89_017252 [Geosiphon pyriformis]|nr:hypothetical protein G9A89_017252 [Geosiphon pyriformis]